MSSTWILEALGRWAVYPPALGLFGVLGASMLLRRTPGARASPPGELPALRRSLWRLGFWLATWLLAATLLRACCQAWNVFGFQEGSSFESLRLVALESRWGGRWIWQPLAAVATLLGLLLRRLEETAGGVLVLLGCVGLAVALPLTGHAAGHLLVSAAQSVHILGAGLWLGTLLVIFLLKLFARGVTVRPLLLGLAPLATTGAVLVVSTGALLVWSSVPGLASLWGSAYGRVLVAKIGLASLILGLGACNFLRLRAAAATRPVPPTVWLELALAGATVVVTGILTALPPP